MTATLDAETRAICDGIMAGQSVRKQLAAAAEHRRNEEFQKAAEIYLSVPAEHPDYLRTRFLFGVMLREMAQLCDEAREIDHGRELNREAAGVFYQIATHPMRSLQMCVDALNSLTCVYIDFAEYETARRCADYVLKLQPNNPPATQNLATLALIDGDYDAAEALANRTLSMLPNEPGAEFTLANIKMCRGNWREGFLDLECRWRLPRIQRLANHTNQPRWALHHDIHGRRVLIESDNGLGDIMQFVRYAPLVKERGARVILYSPHELETVLKTADGIDEIVTEWPPDDDFDFVVPAMLLPGIFGTMPDTVPQNIPYLHMGEHSPPQDGKLHVGIVWASTQYVSGLDVGRSAPVEQFAALFGVPNVTWHSFQYGASARDGDRFPQLQQTSATFKTFEDTARALNSIHLLISVDTSIIHLAGGMGRQVWALIPDAKSVWVWLPSKTATPFYPTMRLFRQPTLGDWDSVFVDVRRELEQLINKKGAPFDRCARE